jgi:O-acetyl-ADP-ribose deacetylase
VTDLVAIQADITTLMVDAIVNAANSELMVGGGVDGAIHRAGGPAIFESMAPYRERGGCTPGEAVIGTGGDLPARFVIHTVGPVWTGADPARHDAVLASCYRSSLALAAEHDLATIAFPGISTGVYGFPKDRAARIAVDSTRTWLDTEPHGITQVTFVCFDAESLDLYRALLA